jgi:hypothetical protein
MSRTIALPTLRTEAMHASARLIHRSAVPRLELFPFRYRNPITSKSVRAVRGIAGGDREGNAEWEIIDPPEMRQLDLDARRSTPVPVRCAQLASLPRRSCVIVELDGASRAAYIECNTGGRHRTGSGNIRERVAYLCCTRLSGRHVTS